MQKIKKLFQSEFILECISLSLISGFVYLIFVSKFGYFYDDWYLMYAAGAKGASVFWDIFAIDRPLRALVMIPAYSFFGANPIYYNLSAFVFRLISGFCFLWILNALWKENRRINFWMAVLFLLYPGFLSQPNAIDYLCHIVGLACGMFSIVLTSKVIHSDTWQSKFLFYFASVIFGWFYLGQIEWYIGLEFFRLACIFIFSFRVNETIRLKIITFLKYALSAGVISGGFLIWRLFFFESERGATDVDLQLDMIRSEPLAFLFNFLSTLFDDVIDVLVRAWGIPLQRLSYEMNRIEWLFGCLIALTVLVLIWIFNRVASTNWKEETVQRSTWRREAILIAVGMFVFGLLPVLLVGRSVDFKSFSRYTLIASVGTALLLPTLLSYISDLKIRNLVFSFFIFFASLTHYFNGLHHAKQTEATRNFWWQVSWRIPQIGSGATLITHYSVVAEEDYFTWGPANLIYYPESDNEKYVQPTLFAVLLNEETVEKVLALETKEYSNRRSIRTYPNYRNILILTQPISTSCVQVIDLRQVEVSSSEDERVKEIAAYSEADQIALDDLFQTPPLIPFGEEPKHDWCYYYQKATYARQAGDWEQISVLGDEAFNLGFSANDPIEWMPFLQAYAYFDNTARIKEIASFVTLDLSLAQQACHTLTTMSLTPNTLKLVDELFCLK